MRNLRGFFRGEGQSPKLTWARTLLFCSLLGILWLTACAPPPPTPPAPLPLYPTQVITEDGLSFAVKGFRLPGTIQEFTVRFDSTSQWIPLDQVQSLNFIGPMVHGYRHAQITMTSGYQLQAEVYVDLVVEGATDLGYWNMSLAKVERLFMGSD